LLDPDQHQSLLYSSDLELGETVQRIFDCIERIKPKRIVIDSLSAAPIPQPEGQAGSNGHTRHPQDARITGICNRIRASAYAL
jgi:hypothetical protein